jgi:virulence-associated protein VapD
MMHRGRIVLALLLGMILITSGCARSKPTSMPTPDAPAQTASAATVTPELIPAEVTYRLAEPVGANPEDVPGPTFTVVVENCAGSSPLERTHSESHALQANVMLDISGLEPSLAAQKAAMEQAVREAYGLASAEQMVEDAVPVSAPPEAHVEFLMRWEETHDTNALEVVAGDRVVARIPVRVIQSAHLIPLSSANLPCPADSQVSVPVIVTEQSGPSEAPQDQATLPPPGSDLAMALVQEYLEALGDSDLERAYGLLHEVYQARVPFESYQEGYATLQELEVHGIEVVQVSRYLERAEALVTLVMQMQGKKRYSDWLMTLDVSITRGKPPYQRSISAVKMQEIGLQ